MEAKKGKENNRVLIGCILYYAVSMGMIGMTNASYGLFPDTYHINVSALGVVSVVCPLFYMLSAAAFSRLEKWLGARGLCFLGAAVVAGMGSKCAPKPKSKGLAAKKTAKCAEAWQKHLSNCAFDVQSCQMCVSEPLKTHIRRCFLPRGPSSRKNPHIWLPFLPSRLCG